MKVLRFLILLLRFLIGLAGFAMAVAGCSMIFDNCASVGMPGSRNGTFYLWECKDTDDGTGYSPTSSGIITVTSGIGLLFVSMLHRFWRMVLSLLPEPKPKEPSPTVSSPRRQTQKPERKPARELGTASAFGAARLGTGLSVIGGIIGVGVVIWALTGHYDGRVYIFRTPVFFAAVFGFAGWILGGVLGSLIDLLRRASKNNDTEGPLSP